MEKVFIMDSSFEKGFKGCLGACCALFLIYFGFLALIFVLSCF